MSDLDAKAAEIMGWERQLITKRSTAPQNRGMIRGPILDDKTYWWSGWKFTHPDSDSSSLERPLFEPSKRWDHVGILIEEGEKRGKPLTITGTGHLHIKERFVGEITLRTVRFTRHQHGVSPPEAGITLHEDEPLSPLIITKAFNWTFGGGEEE